MLLEAYMKSDKPILPDFLDIVKEVTGDPAYSLYTIALNRRVPELDDNEAN